VVVEVLEIMLEQMVLEFLVVVVEDLVVVIHLLQMDKQHNQKQIAQHQHIQRSQITDFLVDFLLHLVVMQLQAVVVLPLLEAVLQEMLVVVEMVALANQHLDLNIH
jgi:hypothetical protein